MKRAILILATLMCVVSCTSKVNSSATGTGATTDSSTTTTTGQTGSNGNGNSVTTAGSSSGGNSTTTPTPTQADAVVKAASYGDATGSFSGYCDAISGIGEQDYDFLKIPIVSHGDLTLGTLWRSSLSDALPSGMSQEHLRTDSTLQVRIWAKAAPKTCSLVGIPSNINANYNYYYPYGKLKLKLALKARNSSMEFEKIEFTDIKVGECSAVKTFRNVPTDQPFVLEVSQVKSDYECASGQFGKDTVCPYAPIVPKACFEIELQVATDDTKRIPEAP